MPISRASLRLRKPVPLGPSCLGVYDPKHGNRSGRKSACKLFGGYGSKPIRRLNKHFPPAVQAGRIGGLKKLQGRAAQTLYVDIWRGSNKGDAKASVNNGHDLPRNSTA